MSSAGKKSESRFCKLARKDAQELRDAIKTNYLQRGGLRDLGTSTISTYKDLADNIDELLSSNGWSVDYYDAKAKVRHRAVKVAPTFLRNLFYVQVAKDAIQAHQYNLDICYLYGFGLTLGEYKAGIGKPARVLINGVESNRFTIVVTAISTYGKEVEKVRSRIEMLLLGATLLTDYRDIASLRNGSLADLYELGGVNTVVFCLVGKDALHDEGCISEICSLLHKAPELLKERTVFIRLEDICRGEFSIGLSSGRLKFVTFWSEQLEAVREMALVLGKKKAGTRKQPKGVAPDHKIVSILTGLDSLMSSISEGARSAPYDHFINHFGTVELEKFLPEMLTDANAPLNG